MKSLTSVVLEGNSLPNCFRELPKPPKQLFLNGSLVRSPRVAIVGTRAASPEALSHVRQVSAALARKGATIVSGGALGVDEAAHRGAIDAGSATVVVGPSGWGAPYPKENRALFCEIVDAGGGYLSAYSDEVSARRHHFFLRNSLLAALCDVMVMAEAPFRSGARNAVAWARRLGRPCCTVLAAPWNSRGSGCLAELRLGGIPVASERDIEAVLQRAGMHLVGEEAPCGPAPVVQPCERSAAKPQDSLLECIRSGASSVDELVERTGQSSADVNHSLLLLQLGGQVRQQGGRYTTSGPE